jgi:hypothetical protein
MANISKSEHLPERTSPTANISHSKQNTKLTVPNLSSNISQCYSNSISNSYSTSNSNSKQHLRVYSAGGLSLVSPPLCFFWTAVCFVASMGSVPRQCQICMTLSRRSMSSKSVLLNKMHGRLGSSCVQEVHLYVSSPDKAPQLTGVYGTTGPQ